MDGMPLFGSQNQDTATAYRDEKVLNEIQIMEYLRQNTDIPIPRVHSWGFTAESPQDLGPFIIMDYVKGTLLSTVLKKPDQEDMVLNPDIDKTILDKIYYQIAHYIFQLSQLAFTWIGAISKDPTSSAWHVTGRPLTYNMNELATVSGYPEDKFPTAPFDRASEYLRSVANEHLTHLWTQRNLADNPEIAQKRTIPRIADYLYLSVTTCDHRIWLIDPQTLEMTAVLDFEFTNAMPAEFTYDPPWWLLLAGPEVWLERCSMEGFVTLYEPRMEQFLRALERVENETAVECEQPGGLALSARMRDSWNIGRFWFDYAARKSFDVDSIYWAALHDEGAGVELLDEKVRAEMESFTRIKMEQLKAYKEES
ncbi:hypothetical protein PENVUL_c012G08199 [Penicillium vulpinum]|uniref:Aminoglycoside phosphotransferase domain-containing protein n=1 Tax=Penicillium vulpinum TaxID=29845 RepID=A0A1V6S1D4_9EURO|nr:hypothetical protein PENVUL_c012G08199 [Penicillium vulpinum]